MSFKPFARLRLLPRDCRGIAAVELAFAAPIVIFLSIGIIDVGRMLWYTTTLESVASRSARFAMVRGAEADTPATEDDIAAYAEGLATGIPNGSVAVEVTWAPNNGPGSFVKVALVHQYHSLLAGFGIPETVTLRGSSTSVVM